MPCPPDRETGKAERFLHLFSRHQQAIRTYIAVLTPGKADADDLMQETSLALWNKWETYDPQRSFVSWACGIARIEVLRHRRRLATSKMWFSEELIGLLASEYEKSESVYAARLEALPNCLDRLGERERNYIRLRYRSGGTIKSVIDATGRPQSTVYRMLSGIRDALRQCIDTYVATGSYPAAR